MPVTQAAILAAGEATKLWPFSETRPACLLPVANTPLIDRLIQQLQRVKVDRIVVAASQNGKAVQLRGHLADRAHVQVIEADPVGTAVALDECLAVLDTDEPTLVAYGDIVTADANLAALLEAFDDGDTSDDSDGGACLVDPLPRDDPRGWIGASVEEAGQGMTLERLIGNARSGEWRMSGVFVVTPPLAGYAERNPGIMRSVPVGGMPEEEAEWAASMNVALGEGIRIEAVPAREYHVDVDKPWHVWEANHLAVQDAVGSLTADEIHPEATVAPDAEIGGRIHVGAGCEIGPSVVIEGNLWMEAGSSVRNGAIVGESCHIGRGSRVTNHCHVGSHTVIGRNCRIGHAAEVEGVLFDGVAVVHYSELSGVVGQGTDIGAATVCGTLRFDDDRTVHETSGFREKPTFGANGSYIGDHGRTGVNAILMPGSKVGAYACVGPGVIVEEAVPSRRLVMVEQETVERPWGPERYGW